MFKVRSDKTLDATVWLSCSKTDTLTFELWHQIVSFVAEEPMLKDYILLNDQVIRVTKSNASMVSLRSFKEKELLSRIPRKTVGSKLQDSFLAFDVFHGRRTIQEVLAL